MIQPLLIGDGWIELKDGDESARTIFDRHYSRINARRGKHNGGLIGPGVRKVLMRANGGALFAWRQIIRPNGMKHRIDDGQRGVMCSIFRNEDSGAIASELIREAVQLARSHWWPEERFYTYVDPRKVTPTMVRGIPCWGWCFMKAGWHYAGLTKSGKLIWALPERRSDVRET